MQTLLDIGISPLTANTPLRYTGGKTQAKQDIYRFFRDMNVKRVVSPFCGGCSFELYASAKGLDVLASDNLHELIVFWRVLSQTPVMLSEKIEEILDSIGFVITKDVAVIEEMYPKCEEILRNAAQACLDATDPTEKSAWLYIRNRTAYQAIMFHFKRGLQVCEIKLGNKLTHDRINGLRDFMTNVEFMELDFKECIKTYSGNYFYLDPPYYDLMIATKYGKEGDIPFDHECLRELLGKEKNWILSYNDIDCVRELYEGYEFVKAEWHHPSRKKQSTRGNEVFIMPKHIYGKLFK